MVFAAALPLQTAGGAMQFAVLRRLPEDSELRRLMEEVVTQFIAVDNPFDLMMLFLAAVVTAAICEEVLFRGLLLQLMRRRAGWVSAVVWSAAMFAVYHLNPVVLLPITLVGAYLGVLVWRSGSLYPAVAAHGLNNGLALFGLPYVVDEAVYADNLAIILAASIGLLAALLYVYLRVTEAPREEGPRPRGVPVTDRSEPASLEEGAPGSAASGRPGSLEQHGVDRGLGDRE